MISHYGIFDFRPEWVCEGDSTSRPLTYFHGEPCNSTTELRAEASPIAHSDTEHPPVLIFNGVEDQTPPIRTARSNRDAMSAARDLVGYQEYEGVGHVYFDRDSDRREDAFQDSQQRMVRMLFEEPRSDI